MRVTTNLRDSWRFILKHLRAPAILVFLIGGVFCGLVFGQTSPSIQELVESGRQYGLAKQFDKAIEAYQAAVNIDPNLFAARAGLGASLIGAGRNGEAV